MIGLAPLLHGVACSQAEYEIFMKRILAEGVRQKKQRFISVNIFVFDLSDSKRTAIDQWVSCIRLTKLPVPILSGARH